MKKALVIALGCVALAACATRQQSVGTTAGAVGGAVVGGPIGAVVGGAAGAVVTAPWSPLGGSYRYRCHYRDRYGYVHYRWCRA